jgi:NDP-sugar pyrophosphorylase family protein
MKDSELAEVPIAILAGGLATRLGRLAEKVPKSLIHVAGKPFLAHQLALLRRQGLKQVVLCVGHLGEMIRTEFGTGADFGVTLTYSFDGPQLIGTGGAVRRALPVLGDRFFVMYGDSYLPTDFRSAWSAFCESGKPGLMTVFRNEDRWDKSNVHFENGKILAYSKTAKTGSMQHIDYGLSAFAAGAFDELPEVFDLSELHAGLIANGELAGHEVAERFYEVGSPDGLAELEKLLGGEKALTR